MPSGHGLGVTVENMKDSLHSARLSSLLNGQKEAKTTDSYNNLEGQLSRSLLNGVLLVNP